MLQYPQAQRFGVATRKIMTGERQWAMVAGIAGLILALSAIILYLTEKISNQFALILGIISIPLLAISAILFSPLGTRIFSPGSNRDHHGNPPDPLDPPAPEGQVGSSETEGPSDDPADELPGMPQRIEYLSLLNHSLNDYVERVEFLATCSHDIVDLELYRRTYIKKFKTGKSNYNPGQQLVYELYKQHVDRDNLVLRAIEDTDEILRELGDRIERLSLQIADSVIRNIVKEFREAVHVGYSYMVFDRLLNLHFEELPLMMKVRPHKGEKMIERIKDIQGRINTMMEKLAAGAKVV